MLVEIFGSLGVDKTVFIQLAILLVTFAICTTFIFPRLQDVLELREKKTVKLEGSAHDLYKKVEELKEKLKVEIEQTHQKEHAASSAKKSELLASNANELKALEEKLSKEYDQKRQNVLAQFKTKKEKVLLEVESLSQNLVEKLTK